MTVLDEVSTDPDPTATRLLSADFMKRVKHQIF